MDSSGSSVHGIFQARVLEWVAISFSRGSPDPGIEPGSPTMQADTLLSEPLRKPSKFHIYALIYCIGVESICKAEGLGCRGQTYRHQEGKEGGMNWVWGWHILL